MEIKIFDKIISTCKDLLLNFPDANEVLKYLDNRLSKESQDKFCFGYFPSNKNLYMFSSLINKDELLKNNLLYEKNVIGNSVLYSPLENHNLILPYKDVYGNIIALVGRTILNDSKRQELDIPKYKNTVFNKGSHLFGLYEAKNSIVKNNMVFIVEGQFDCIKAHDKGFCNVVALGSSNMTFDQFSLITRYTNNLMILLDNDQAGKTGTEKIINNYSKYANIKQVHIPETFKDLDEYFQNYTVEDFFFSLKL